MRKFQPVQKKDQRALLGMTTLPLDHHVSIYPRQSTMKQVGNVATDMQTDDLITFAMKYGWAKDNIIMYVEDLGVSGKLRMDEREGFSKMLHDITSGKVKAVIAFQVDRLFRDEWGIEYGKFMEICFKYGVIVVTPEFVYDFSVDWHVDRFRRKCEEAYSYLRNQIKGRLLAARDRVAQQGLYTCGGIPTGYIIDRHPKVNGMPNPTYRKYIPYEPHARIVRRLFERFRETGGNLCQIYRELQEHSIVFPELDESVDARTATRVVLRKVPGGYHLSLQGLRTLLTNPAYIGWWLYKGEVVDRENHEPIIDEELFWYAFNHLSPYAVDGSVNEAALKRPHATYTHKGRPASEALLKDIIRADTPTLRVYVDASEKRPGRKQEACYKFRHRTNALEAPCYVLPIKEVDGMFVDRLVSHLRETSDFATYHDHLEKQQAALHEQQEDIQVHIDAVLSQMAAIEQNLKSLTSQRLVEKMNKDYGKLEEELTRLEQSKGAPKQQQLQIQQLLTYHELMSRLDWHKDVTLEEKKVLITLLAEHVTLTILSPRFYKMTIQWRVPSWGTEEAVIHRSGRPALHWTAEEDGVLTAMYEICDKQTLQEMLPWRSWMSIHTRARRTPELTAGYIHGKGASVIPDDLCLKDYEIMQQYHIAVSDLENAEAEGNYIEWAGWQSTLLPLAGVAIG